MAQIFVNLLCKSDKKRRRAAALREKVICEGLRAVLLVPTTREPRRLLTLLHGAEESPEIIRRNFELSPWVERGHIAVLMPALGNSFCLDWGGGLDVRSALLDDLLPAIQERYGLSPKREDHVVGGISMGGFAALSLALGSRERFCAAFSLSGALDLRKSAQFFRICGLSAPGDLLGAAQRPETQLEARLQDLDNKPSLYLGWSDRDWFRGENRAFSRKAAELGYEVRASESTGLHNWDFWKQSLGPALDWASMTA